MKVALIDGNSFYASCETSFRPDLKGRPVVVLSNNDGCIVALNQAAKDLGIERTTPLFQVKDLVESKKVEVFSSNYTLYGDISDRIRTIYRLFTPTVEDYSIDESFLWFPDNYGVPCPEIRSTVLQWTGIPVTIGIGPTKVLAKAANRLAKKTPSGSLEILRDEWRDIMREFPVDKVWGIGPATSRNLQGLGITTALAFADMDPFDVKKRFTLVGWKIQQELRGNPQIDLEVPSAKDNILTSRSFSHPVTELADLEEAVADYASGAGEKLRAQGSVTALVEVMVTTNYFHLEDPQYSRSILVRLPHPSDYTPDLVGAAHHGLLQIFKPGYKYKKAGVTLLGLEAAKGLQGGLFCKADPKLEALQKAVDGINQRHGRATIRCSTRRSSADWMMRRDQMSPRYTTRWEELLKVR
jgi:DNA polymerase V